MTGEAQVDLANELAGRLSWNRQQLASHRRAALREAVGHAVAASPWHRERLAGIDVSTLETDDLRSLPVMTKRDLMAAWDRVVTDPALSLALAREHLDRVDRDGLSPLLSRYWVFTTGGTTGEPAVFVWPLDSVATWFGSVGRWLFAGSGPPARGAWVAARSMRHPSAAITRMHDGGGLDLCVPVDQPIESLVQRLNELQPDTLSTICSMLPVLAEQAEAGRLAVRVRTIVVFGDVLDPAAARRAEAVFGAPVLETYPTTDVGHIACQTAGENGMYVNDDLLIVEGVDEHDRPVPAGTPTHHLLVTSLYQHTLPLIRYRIDDRLTFATDAGRVAPAFNRITHIDGRADDLFRYNRAVVHPHVFRSVLSAYHEVTDFRVEQTPSGALVLVQGEISSGRLEALRSDLALGLQRAGVTAAVVEVRAVPHLPRTQMGKRIRFAPLP